MLKIAFLCSGGGGNLRFVFSIIKRKNLDSAVISVVIADRECPATEFARDNSIPVFIIDFSTPEQEDLINLLAQFHSDIVVSNVHRILRARVVDLYKGKLINLHYSFLPAFGGLIGAKPIEMALQYGSKFIGVTAHYIDESLDNGRPISQAVIPVYSDDNVDNIMNIVFRVGCGVLLSAIYEKRDTLSNRENKKNQSGNLLSIFGRQVFFNPSLLFDFDDEGIWSEINI